MCRTYDISGGGYSTMSVDSWLERVRTQADKWFTPIVIILLVLLIVSGWSIASTALDDEVETNGEFRHSATVQESNPLFATGTELTDRSVYFTTITPELDGQFVYSHTGDEEYIVQTQLSARTQAVNDDDEELWTVSQELETDETAVGPDERHTVPFTLNVENEVARMAAVEQYLGEDEDAQTQLIIVARTTVMTEGGVVVGTDEHELPIELSETTYQVNQEGADGFESVPLDTGLVLFIGVFILFLGCGILLPGLVIARKYDILAPWRTQPSAAHRRERKRFDDWISTGTLPKQYTQDSQVEVDSLQDLVDVAIDCDRRVIEDRTQGQYYVIDGTSVYTYTPSRALSVGEGGDDGEGAQTASAEQ